MKDTLKAGIELEHTIRVTEAQLVPALYPDAPEFGEMPGVFATGFMIGFLEWACLLAVKPHIDWPAEQTVGAHVDVSHSAATPPGMNVTARVRLVEVEGRKLVFDVEAHDDVDEIARGKHVRYVVARDRFDAGIAKKIAGAR